MIIFDQMYLRQSIYSSSMSTRSLLSNICRSFSNTTFSDTVIPSVVAVGIFLTCCRLFWSMFLSCIAPLTGDLKTDFRNHFLERQKNKYLIEQKFVEINCRNFGLVSNNFSSILIQKVRKRSDEIVKISAWCRKFCPTKFFPIRYASGPLFFENACARAGSIILIS